MNKYITTILKEQFRRVNADFPTDEKYFKKENWFWDKEWTTEEEQDFKKWLFDYMIKNKRARQELMMFTSKSKKNVKRFVDEFIMDYGWKTIVSK